jgi:hypothetical protein
LACLRYCASVRIAEAHLERRTMVPYGPDWLVWLAGCDDACEATVRPASSWRGVDWMRWDGADDLELCRVRWRWQGYLTGDRGLAQISYSCTSPLMSDTAKYPTVRVSMQNMQHTKDDHTTYTALVSRTRQSTRRCVLLLQAAFPFSSCIRARQTSLESQGAWSRWPSWRMQRMGRELAALRSGLQFLRTVSPAPSYKSAVAALFLRY